MLLLSTLGVIVGVVLVVAVSTLLHHRTLREHNERIAAIYAEGRPE